MTGADIGAERYIRVPNTAMFAAQPFTERQRLYRALKDLLADWATSEIERID